MFTRMVSFESKRGKFNDKGDSNELSKVLGALQARGAVIKAVTPKMVHATENKLTVVLFVILYESGDYIDV